VNMVARRGVAVYRAGWTTGRNRPADRFLRQPQTCFSFLAMVNAKRLRVWNARIPILAIVAVDGVHFAHARQGASGRGGGSLNSYW